MKEQFRLLTIGFLIQLTTMSFGRFAYTLILPNMMKSLRLSTTMMGLLGTAIVIGYLLHSLLSGNLAAIIGEESTVHISMFMSSISLFCLGYFSQYPLLFISSAGIGAGAAGSYIPLIAILNRRFDVKGKVFGFVMGGAGVGIMLCGYIIPPLLTLSGRYGYRLSWYVLSMINTAVLVLSFIFLKPAGMQKLQRNTESRAYSVIRLLKNNTQLVTTIIIYFFVGFSYIIYVTYFGAYSTDEVGFTIKSTGFMWALFGMNSIYSGIIWGTFSDRINKVNVATLLTSILALSFIIIIPFRFEPLFYVSTFLFGLSFLGLIIVIASLISESVGKNEMAQIFGASTFLHGVGQIFGTALTGPLRDITQTFKVPFSLSIFVLFICIFLFALLKRKERDENDYCAR